MASFHDKENKTLWSLERQKLLILGLPCPRSSGHSAPWGYKTVGDVYIPKEDSIQLLVQAKAKTKYASYDTVAAWLSKVTGDSISGMGLHKIFKFRPVIDELALPYEYRRQLYLTFTEGFLESLEETARKLQEGGEQEKEAAES